METGPKLLASSVQKVASTLSDEKPFGKMALRLGEERRIHLPGKARTWAEMPAMLAKAIHGCIDGLERWPLFIFGPAGTGKTCAALCVSDLGRGEYFTVSDLVENHNAAKLGRYEEPVLGQCGWRPNAFTFRLSKLARPPLVILDELGARSVVTDSHYEAVKYALDLREGKPLIAISNLAPKNLAAVYDARIVSRLCSGSMFEMTGQDRRLQ